MRDYKKVVMKFNKKLLFFGGALIFVVILVLLILQIKLSLFSSSLEDMSFEPYSLDEKISNVVTDYDPIVPYNPLWPSKLKFGGGISGLLDAKVIPEQCALFNDGSYPIQDIIGGCWDGQGQWNYKLTGGDNARWGMWGVVQDDGVKYPYLESPTEVTCGMYLGFFLNYNLVAKKWQLDISNDGPYMSQVLRGNIAIYQKDGQDPDGVYNLVNSCATKKSDGTEFFPSQISIGAEAPPVCGNGRKDEYEECDLGSQNGAPGSVCSSTCTSCGNRNALTYPDYGAFQGTTENYYDGTAPPVDVGYGQTSPWYTAVRVEQCDDGAQCSNGADCTNYWNYQINQISATNPCIGIGDGLCKPRTFGDDACDEFCKDKCKDADFDSFDNCDPYVPNPSDPLAPWFPNPVPDDGNYADCNDNNPWITGETASGGANQMVSGKSFCDKDKDSYTDEKYFKTGYKGANIADCNDDITNDPIGITCPDVSSSYLCDIFYRNIDNDNNGIPDYSKCAFCAHPGIREAVDNVDNDCSGYFQAVRGNVFERSANYCVWSFGKAIRPVPMSFKFRTEGEANIKLCLESLDGKSPAWTAQADFVFTPDQGSSPIPAFSTTVAMQEHGYQSPDLDESFKCSSVYSFPNAYGNWTVNIIHNSDCTPGEGIVVGPGVKNNLKLACRVKDYQGDGKNVPDELVEGGLLLSSYNGKDTFCQMVDEGIQMVFSGEGRLCSDYNRPVKYGYNSNFIGTQKIDIPTTSTDEYEDTWEIYIYKPGGIKFEFRGGEDGGVLYTKNIIDTSDSLCGLLKIKLWRDATGALTGIARQDKIEIDSSNTCLKNNEQIGISRATADLPVQFIDSLRGELDFDKFWNQILPNNNFDKSKWVWNNGCAAKDKCMDNADNDGKESLHEAVPYKFYEPRIEAIDTYSESGELTGSADLDPLANKLSNIRLRDQDDPQCKFAGINPPEGFGFPPKYLWPADYKKIPYSKGLVSPLIGQEIPYCIDQDGDGFCGCIQNPDAEINTLLSGADHITSGGVQTITQSFLGIPTRIKVSKGQSLRLCLDDVNGFSPAWAATADIKLVYIGPTGLTLQDFTLTKTMIAHSNDRQIVCSDEIAFPFNGEITYTITTSSSTVYGKRVFLGTGRGMYEVTYDNWVPHFARDDGSTCNWIATKKLFDGKGLIKDNVKNTAFPDCDDNLEDDNQQYLELDGTLIPVARKYGWDVDVTRFGLDYSAFEVHPLAPTTSSSCQLGLFDFNCNGNGAIGSDKGRLQRGGTPFDFDLRTGVETIADNKVMDEKVFPLNLFTKNWLPHRTPAEDKDFLCFVEAPGALFWEQAELEFMIVGFAAPIAEIAFPASLIGKLSSYSVTRVLLAATDSYFVAGGLENCLKVEPVDWEGCVVPNAAFLALGTYQVGQLAYESGVRVGFAKRAETFMTRLNSESGSVPNLPHNFYDIIRRRIGFPNRNLPQPSNTGRLSVRSAEQMDLQDLLLNRRDPNVNAKLRQIVSDAELRVDPVRIETSVGVIYRYDMRLINSEGLYINEIFDLKIYHYLGLPKTGEISIHIFPEWKRLGASKRLMDEAFDIMEQNGVKNGRSYFSQDNALRFHERLEFHRAAGKTRDEAFRLSAGETFTGRQWLDHGWQIENVDTAQSGNPVVNWIHP